MSLLFDAVGHWAIGHTRDSGTYTMMVASAGSFSAAGIAASFLISMASLTGSYALSGVNINLPRSMALSVGNIAVTGFSSALVVAMPSSAGSYVLTGYDVTFSDDANLARTPRRSLYSRGTGYWRGNL